MPIFLFQCTKCKETFEKLQKTDEPPKTCPGCHETNTLKKQISAPSGFQLKGTGWYKTDFRNK